MITTCDSRERKGEEIGETNKLEVDFRDEVLVWPRINIVDGLALRLRDISQPNVRSKHDEGLGWEFPRHGKVEPDYLASSIASADLLDRRLKCQTLHKFTHAFPAIRRLWDVYTQFVAIRDQRGVNKYFIDSLIIIRSSATMAIKVD